MTSATMLNAPFMPSPALTGSANKSGPRVRPPLAFLASTLSASIGRNGYYIASTWILVNAGYGINRVAVFLAIVSIVEFIVSPLIGVAADRFDRRLLNITAELGRFGTLITAACTVIYLDTFWAIWLSAAIFAFWDRAALTTAQSMIPALQRARDLAAANSTIFFVAQVGNLGAALLAGPLLQGHSPALALTVFATFFAFSAGFMSWVRSGSAFLEGREIKSSAVNLNRRLVRAVFIYALLYGSAMLVSVVGSSFVFEEQSGNAVEFSLLEAGWSAGSLMGAALLVPLTRVMSTYTLHFMLLGATASAFMTLATLDIPWALIAFAALGLFYNLGRASVEFTLQSLVVDHALGQAKGIMHSAAVALGLIIFAVSAAVGDKVLPSTVFFSFGMMLFIILAAWSASTAICSVKAK